VPETLGLGQRGVGNRDVHRAQVLDRQLALGRRSFLSAHRQAARGRATDHFDCVSQTAEKHVPRALGRRRPRKASSGCGRCRCRCSRRRRRSAPTQRNRAGRTRSIG
jgi:hypothetical protein